VINVPGVEEFRHVGLLERAHHSRMRFTSAIKNYFGAGSGAKGLVQGPVAAGRGRRIRN
jgi:hypothetical protein